VGVAAEILSVTIESVKKRATDVPTQFIRLYFREFLQRISLRKASKPG
jgi:hypothetical protein